MKIPFNKPFLIGNELEYIKQAVAFGKISGDGMFTKKCQDFFQERYGFKKVLLTTSCTDALEMCAILLEIRQGDEIIIPSYTFVSTANAFVLRGAKIVFTDSNSQNPNVDVCKIEQLITDKTKAIVVVHYAGIACDMDVVMNIAKKHNLFVVEDSAQSIDSYYKGKPLGSIGHLAAFSFHETKNVISGEGGMIVINENRFIKRAEIIREKGTNRSAFFRGEIDKYGWVDIGSSYLPSEIIAAYLWAQLENLNKIQTKRRKIFRYYFKRLEKWSSANQISLPIIPQYASNNAHMFYLICDSFTQRGKLIEHLKKNGVHSVFHYQSLHKSDYYRNLFSGEELINSDRYSDCLLRLPLFYELTLKELGFIVDTILAFDKGKK